MTLKNILLYAFVLTIIFVFYSCDKNEVLQTSKPQYEIVKPDSLPMFISSNAYDYIARQVSFGPRNPGSTGHEQALNYLRNELAKYADEISVQNFSYPGYDETLSLTNIIGKFNPSAKNRILLAAHWDTRPRAEESKDTSKQNLPIIGANDGGSGVGVLLEIARLLKESKINYGVDIIFLDGEDYGKRNDLGNYCLGAKYFSANIPDNYRPAFGILLDMVGDKEAEFTREGHSLQYASDVVDLIWNTAAQIGATAFDNRESPEIYDDHVPFNQAGIKMADIIDLELIGADTPNPRRNYWHSEKDLMDNIGKETLQQVGDVLTYIIYSLKFN